LGNFWLDSAWKREVNRYFYLQIKKGLYELIFTFLCWIDLSYQLLRPEPAVPGQLVSNFWNGI
jgi:hypothetical protein